MEHKKLISKQAKNEDKRNKEQMEKKTNNKMEVLNSNSSSQ